ncbi:phosphatidylserine decarboxylase 1 [Sarracenia purpurea var. burkii]
MKFRVSQRFTLVGNHTRISHFHQQRLCFSSFLRKVQKTRVPASINGGRSSHSEGNSFLVPGATVATIVMLGALHARRLYDDKKLEEARDKGIEFEFQPDAKISPVDGTVLRFGEVKEAGTMIEQVKGISYSVSSLLGASSFLPGIAGEDVQQESRGKEKTPGDENKRSWWRISLASPKVREPAPTCPMKGLFYCVIYLNPGDYHRIHSPVDWNVLGRRHFSGRLFPVNERATRTIRNLYVENERVVLEGRWKEGFIAMAAIGATNIGSIELFIEPALQTNRPRKKLLHSEPPEERFYEPEGVGVMLRKGDEVAAFNMGSTVVLVFQAPTSKLPGEKSASSEFTFSIQRGDRVRVGEPLGRWYDS